ncbi:MAG: CRISPR-associated protein Cas4 [Candidatus Thiodiazotropha sp. (ex Lucinoma kastoroae)]|nr:CRISPR-associated protein Cas4 [Candidatus Thiodiazotropha sp. (ex Lucinoma kastoroae)]MCU7858439.1 CRISPR-associated protein Cas4 [Candidatus Thiodiazotropha sp. (ex Lucinoma kastoroae)]
MNAETQLLMLSALQHYAYCPRQFALIHIEQVWEENRFTAEGRVLHERVDSGVAEQRRSVRYERGVLLRSQCYRLTGKMDLLEIEQGDPPCYFPVEYKRGKPKVEDWDRIQLCAQALCIEDMRDVELSEGAIWYWEARKREPVIIDGALRKTTIDVIEGAHALLASGKTPHPTENRKLCRACSLVDLCEPDTFRRDHSASYINELFAQ